MVTEAERDLILNMLSAGRITAEQAAKLFDAVERCAEDAEICDFPTNWHDFNRKLEHSLRKEISQVSHVLNAMDLAF